MKMSRNKIQYTQILKRRDKAIREIKLRMNEQKKYEVIKKLVETDGNKDRAALSLGVTRRHINRLIKGYKEQGKAFFVHGNRGRKPSTTISDDVRDHIITLYNEKYYDANFIHFTELLERYEGIHVSVSSVRNILEDKYILSPMVTRTKQKRIRRELRARQQTAAPKEAAEIQKNIVAVEDAHTRKPRKAFFGEMEQLDASPYKWFGDSVTHLHIAVDDCTGRITAARFDEQETLNGYYNLFYQILTNYGIPYGFFTDRRTVFEYRKKGTSDLEEDTYTQFAYACKQLGVELECSSVPQAKSRVERMFKTLQSRLPVELRLAGITEMDTANEFLSSYIEKYNAEFALPLDNIRSVFEEQPDVEKINLTLAVLTERTVDCGHAVRIYKRYYRMLDRNGRQVHYRKGTKVIVIKAFDGELFCAVNDNTVLALEEIPDFEPCSRSFASSVLPEQKEPRPRKLPAMDHPWRRTAIKDFAGKQQHRIEMELAANQ